MGKKKKVDLVKKAKEEKEHQKRKELKESGECIWDEKINKYGNTYYHNKATDEKVYRRPKELLHEKFCHSCDIGLATWKCKECFQQLCTHCDQLNHNDTTKPENFNHVREPLKFEWWLVGDRLQLHGLKRKQELNGMLATILEIRDFDKKFCIRLDNGKIRNQMSSKYFRRLNERQLDLERKEVERLKAIEDKEKALEEKI